jgi:sulfofructose kinase
MASEIPPVVFVGSLTLDAIALVDHLPGPDERQVAREVVYAGGGPAATAAVACARLGVPAAVVGVVGADDEGERILEGLRAEGVDVTGVRVAPGEASGASVVVVDAGAGTRSICTRPVPRLTLASRGPAADLLDAAPWVHADHLGWRPVSDLLDGRTASARPRLSVDGGNPIAGFHPVGVDLYVPTIEALIREYGDQSVDRLLAAALADGARAVVATSGSRGCFAATADGVRLEAQGRRVDVVSTLGAGDVFHGALLAAVVRGLPLPHCLRYANVAAALSCRALDGRSAIPAHDGVMSLVESADQSFTPTVSS